MIRIIALASVAALVTVPAHADWTLANDESRISFVTTKAGQIAEVHRFHSVDGMIDDAGNVRVTIDLSSVDTLIPIRDERMRDILFEVAQFPEATLTGKVDMAVLDGLADGETTTVGVEGALAMHGETLSLTLEFHVARLSGSRVVASTLQPVVVNASQVALVEGVEELREIAGLPSISPAVPVTAVLTFNSSM
jgi:polyisoprenoid-binding protein YceI